jgi:hypothetical protein
MSLKPILKRSDHEQPHKTTHFHTHRHPDRNHGVHFPPSPLTCTYSAYSATAYDRSPIVVSPNNCALPERGCPGRTYTIEESATHQRRGISYALDFHPRALAFASSRSNSPCSTRTPINAAEINERPSFYPTLPQLIPDLSSESDESDGSSSIPSASTTSFPAFGIHGLAGPPSKYFADACNNEDMNRYTPRLDDSNALTFLPYPPSPPSHKYQYAESVDPFMQNTRRRRRGERESKHESSRDPERIPRSGSSDSQHSPLVFSSLSISSSPIPVTPKKRTTKKQLAPMSPPQSNFGSLDDGCLGGF